MAFEAYVKITGQAQGDFKGESSRKGREEWLPMLRFEWGVESPSDVATGASAGRRRHKPFTFWKELGASTPQIFQAICANENLTVVKVELTRTNKQGQEEVSMTIEFADARIGSVDYSAGGAQPDGEARARRAASANSDLFEQEAVALTYRKVTLTHNVASTSATDDWTTVD